MSHAPGSPRAQIASIALAGTVGAMGMLGYRRGGAVELFAAGGHLLIARVPLILAALAGLVIHILWMLLWSALFAAISRRGRGGRAAIAAALIASIAFAASFIIPATLLGPLGTLTDSERALVHVVLAVSLIIGGRLAPRGDAWVA